MSKVRSPEYWEECQIASYLRETYPEEFEGSLYRDYKVEHPEGNSDLLWCDVEVAVLEGKYRGDEGNKYFLHWLSTGTTETLYFPHKLYRLNVSR